MGQIYDKGKKSSDVVKTLAGLEVHPEVLE